MKHLIRVGTTSTATLEAVSPPYNLSTPDPQQTFERGIQLTRSAARQGAELVCLPETFAHAGMPTAEALETAQPLDGAWASQLRDVAREESIHLVAGAFVDVDGGVRNSALLIDPSGELAGRYDKIHPTEGELRAGVTAGDVPLVAETSLGRIGLSICFDLNWPGDWATMRGDDADLVVFLSAYEGGFPLRALAWQHRLHVVTSVWPYAAQIIDPLGRSIASTSRWTRTVVRGIDLDSRLFHVDGQVDRLSRLVDDMSAALNVETLTSEHLVIVSRKDPAIDLGEVVSEYELVELDDYLANSQEYAAKQDARV